MKVTNCQTRSSPKAAASAAATAPMPKQTRKKPAVKISATKKITLTATHTQIKMLFIGHLPFRAVLCLRVGVLPA